MQAGEMEFELTLGEPNGPDDVDVEGAVSSPELDRDMHPKGKVALYISTRRKKSDGHSGFVLDSFHLHSLQEYLERQSYVRDVLERELPRDQEAVDPDGDPVRGQVWSWARVRQLQLRQRDIEGINRQTRTCFVVSVECDWAQDYALEATFRDGQFVGLEPF